MPSYFEHMAGKGGRAMVELDVVEFDVAPLPQHEGIEVTEKRFDSTAEYLAFIARETGRGP